MCAEPEKMETYEKGRFYKMTLYEYFVKTCYNYEDLDSTKLKVWQFVLKTRSTWLNKKYLLLIYLIKFYINHSI